MVRILVTGGSGFIGSHLINRLKKLARAPLVPINCYGRTKLCGEYVIQSIVPENFVIFRIFNCYGPHCRRSYVIPDTIRKLRSSEDQIYMLGTGEEARDFIYIDNVLDAFVKAIETDVVGIFNLGTGKVIKIKNLVRLIAGIMGRDGVEITFQGKMRKGDFRVNCADINASNKISRARIRV